MARANGFTEGVLARDTVATGGGVAFFYGRGKTPVVKTDIRKIRRLDSFSKWGSDVVCCKKEWTPEAFKKAYGFLPRTGKTEEYYLVL